ncbi:carboxypeptidase A1-like [Diabrotica virgifera virgifera]|uniref:Carboxypeptidase A1-like n=1 Tax=Diabrotica virgifera virgifera TaxID=50390 RepID=A0A6P7FAA8_DIAVI|nr:carboxypeptidase A1-like [Diabrotica virgifera virgifera]
MKFTNRKGKNKAKNERKSKKEKFVKQKTPKKLRTKRRKANKKSNHSLNRKGRYTTLSENKEHKFNSYEEIEEFLVNLLQMNSSNLQIIVIGESQEGKPIYLVSIANTDEITEAIFIEAGSNGEDCVAVQCALHIIKYLVETASTCNYLKTMRYYIVPCSNPDAFEINKLGQKPCFNLSTNFPLRLGNLNIDNIDLQKFLEAARNWKESYQFKSPEQMALLKALATFQYSIKIFISLQEEGFKITYPYGTCKEPIPEVEDIRRIALLSRSANTLCFQVGSIYQLFGLRFGTVIDFITMFFNSIKFCYIFHINSKNCSCNTQEISERAMELLQCLALMGQEVSELCKKQSSDDNIVEFI